MPGAFGTIDYRRVSPAVEKNQALFFAFQALPYRLDERIGQTVYELLSSGVDAMYGGQHCIFGSALAKRKQMIAAHLCIMKAFQRKGNC